MLEIENTLVDVGFTGTQKGMTDAQAATLKVALVSLAPGRFHHGGCIGSDAEADAIAYSLGYEMHLHPPIKRDKVANLWRDISKDTVYEAREYLDRDTDIAKAAQILIATPRETHEVMRSGTWATIRRGRKHSTFVVIIWPDGSWEVDDGNTTP
jgi:hypothetical protein